MTTKQKFDAAVNVIRSLPKSGTYQPSHETMLRFYSYFKQATEGPCTQNKPPFWDLVGKYKWEHWMRLGNMPKEEAMENYVREFKRIAEKMSFNGNVGNLLGGLNEVYANVPVADLELLLGPMIERVRSLPGSPLQGSPLGSRDTSPTRVSHDIVNKDNLQNVVRSSSSASSSPQPPDTDDDEEFIDTVETTSQRGAAALPRNEERQQSQTIRMNGHATEVRETSITQNGSAYEVSEPIRDVVLRLQNDLDNISERVRLLEVSQNSSKDNRRRRGGNGWLQTGLTPRGAFLIFAWPILVHLIISQIQRRRRNLN